MIARSQRCGGAAATAILAALIVACGSPAPSEPAAPTNLLGLPAPPYQIVDLGTLGGTYSSAADVNTQNQVVGTSTTADGSNHAFLWQEGVMIDLGTLGGTTSDATQINEHGQIVGSSTNAAGEAHAFLWADGVMTDLGPSSYGAIRVSQRGQVAWTGPNAAGQRRAFLWTDGVAQELGALSDTGQSQVYDLNELGQVVGASDSRPFVWTDGAMRELVSLGGLAWAASINNRGQVVGTSYAPLGPDGAAAYALLWDGDQMTRLGRLPADSFSDAKLITDAGMALVHSYPLAWYPPRPFVWTAGVMTPVATAFQYLMAADMNNLGVIVGEHRPSPFAQRGFVWQFGDAVLDLPLLPGGNNAGATALNELGTIVGWAAPASSSDHHAVLWRKNLLAASK
jgi:probable HAF family extracellular repeat protein